MSSIELTINGKVFIHKFELHSYEHLNLEHRTDLRNEIIGEEVSRMKGAHERAMANWAYTIFVTHESRMNFGNGKRK